MSVGHGSGRKLQAVATLAVDTAGAGDWTTAGFLEKMRGRDLSPDSIETALRFGQVLAAIACAVPGARTLMNLRREAVLRRVHQVQLTGSLSRPRLPTPKPTTCEPGECRTCLMPIRLATRLQEGREDCSPTYDAALAPDSLYLGLMRSSVVPGMGFRPRNCRRPSLPIGSSAFRVGRYGSGGLNPTAASESYPQV
jgi:hypothetical protein